MAYGSLKGLFFFGGRGRGGKATRAGGCWMSEPPPYRNDVARFPPDIYITMASFPLQPAVPPLSLPSLASIGRQRERKGWMDVSFPNL